MNLGELKRKKMTDLIHMGSELNIEGVSGMRRQDLIFALLQSTAAKGEVYGDGVLETLPITEEVKRVIIDGVMRIGPGAPVKVADAAAQKPAAEAKAAQK